MQKENEVKKESFFKSVIKSVKDLDKYEDFALEKTSETVKYFFKLLLIVCFCIAMTYTYIIVTNTKKMYSNLKDKIPNFTYENKELITDNEEPIVIEEYKNTIGSLIIDTGINSAELEEQHKDQISKYGSALIIAREKLIFVNSKNSSKMEYKYSDLLSAYNIQQGNKQQLVEYIDNLNIVSICFAVFLAMIICEFIALLVTSVIDILIVAFLGFFSSRIFRISIKFRVAFNIAIHALTLPIILNMIYMVVNLLTGFNIKYFQIMYYTIAYIYVVVAILMIKTDFINRQAELIKMAQEQLKIKEDLDKPEEKEEKQEEKEENKDDSNNEKKQKRKKENNPDEPIGDATSTIKESE